MYRLGARLCSARCFQVEANPARNWRRHWHWVGVGAENIDMKPSVFIINYDMMIYEYGDI